MNEKIKDHQWFVDLCKQEYYKKVGEESRKTWLDKVNNKGDICFWQKYTKGRHGKGLDIGYKGYLDNVVPILPTAIGVTLDYPGYDGVTLPFDDNSQDFVYSSHVLEHIGDVAGAHSTIIDWFRVTKPGGFIIIVVPHRVLYEKKEFLPSLWNEDHRRFYTPATLLKEIEESLDDNKYRVRHLRDNDEGHDYNQPTNEHSKGQYEIELVIEKL